MNSLTFLSTGDSIVLALVENGTTKQYNVTPDHVRYAAITKYLDKVESMDLSDEEVSKLKDLLDIKKEILEATNKAGDKISIGDESELFFIPASNPDDKIEVDCPGLTERLIALLQKKAPVSYLINFLHNLYENSSMNSVKQLYGFISANDLPITPDGYFLAYKKVRLDYLDFHSGTFSNKVGKHVSMRRVDVNDNPQQTCSAGLHVCSKGYLGCFCDGRLMVVKVNPKDVVSVPVDYENSKMRVCDYDVVDEILDNTMSDLMDSNFTQDDKKEISSLTTSVLNFYKKFFKITKENTKENSVWYTNIKGIVKGSNVDSNLLLASFHKSVTKAFPELDLSSSLGDGFTPLYYEDALFDPKNLIRTVVTIRRSNKLVDLDATSEDDVTE